MSSGFQHPDQRSDDKKGDQSFRPKLESDLVFQYLEVDEPLQPGLDLYSKDKVKVNKVYIYEAENEDNSPTKTKYLKSNNSKWFRRRDGILRNRSEYSDASPRSPKKMRVATNEELFAHAMVKLPEMKPEDKGPKITYNDGITSEQLDRLRRESTNRIQAKKRRESEVKQMIQQRNNRYNVGFSFDNDKVPDFEKQLTHAFNLKFKRADALGVRNIIIDEHQMIRASRPNMDKLVVIEKLRHEIREPRRSITDSDLKENMQMSKGFPKTFEDFEFDSKREDVDVKPEVSKPPRPVLPSKEKYVHFVVTIFRSSRMNDSISQDKSIDKPSVPSQKLSINKSYTGKQDIGKV